MFSKFTSILQHAVGALAPQLSLQEEFVFHWKAVTNFFIDNKGDKLPIEQTNVAAHLEQMLVILQQEETQGERGMYGPCLEYLLQHKLLETLYSLGRTDYPPGMKQVVLSFFTRLLSRVKQPLLAHVNVYKAVQRTIKSCGEVKAGPSEIEEIQFLCTVCAKIKADPYLVNFFLEVPKPTPVHGSSVASSGAGSVMVDEPSPENKLQQDFHLIKTLLTLSHSEDSRVAVKACEGLMLCSSLPDPVAAHCMVNSTRFCADLTERLTAAYKNLPADINPTDLEKVQAKWGLEVITRREDDQTFSGKRQVVTFLSWLDYCDQLSTIANPIVAEALARNIHQHFLIPHFQPDLLQMSESGCVTATAYMSQCLRTVCSERMLSELVLFLLGEERGPEIKGERTDHLRSRLINRCKSLSEEICLVTLQLFDTLLQKDDENIIHNLVLRNLEHRGYRKPSNETRSSNKCSNTSESSDDPLKSSSNVNAKGDAFNQSSTDSGLEVTCLSTGSESQSEAEFQTEALNQSENEIQTEAKSQIENEIQNEAELESKTEAHTEMKSHTEGLPGTLDDNEHIKSDEVPIKCDPVYIADSSAGKTDHKSIGETPESGLRTDTLVESGSLESKGDLSILSTPEHVKTEVHKVVNSFLTLLPEELKSSYQTADTGYDMYLKDAHKQYSAMVEGYKAMDYHDCHKPTDGTFYEGSFLHIILDKLSHMLDQSYSINLQLTSIVSLLALVPQPCVHEYLLEPHIALKQGTRNLFSVLQKISKDIESQFTAEPDLGRKLVQERHKLIASPSGIQKADSESRLKAIIVYEEFCKELAAIAFVKHHASVTREK